MLKPFDWQAATKEQWNHEAKKWNARSEKMWKKGSRKDIIPFIEKEVPNGASVLDIGCGDGYGSYLLSLAGYRPIGIDLSEEMISLARQTHQKLEFQQGSIHDLAFKEHTFDTVMAINVLEWLENPLHGLQEIHRVLKKEGKFFSGILGPTAGPRKNSYPRMYGENAICNTMMPWEFQQMAIENGFMYKDGFGVYKKGVTQAHYQGLPEPLQQSLTFMWIFYLEKIDKVE